jgi:hypothetical protein
VDFYSPEIKLSVQGKLVNESLAPKRLELEFGYYTQNPMETSIQLEIVQKKLRLILQTGKQKVSLVLEM